MQIRIVLAQVNTHKMLAESCLFSYRKLAESSSKVCRRPTESAVERSPIPPRAFGAPGERAEAPIRIMFVSELENVWADTALGRVHPPSGPVRRHAVHHYTQSRPGLGEHQ